MAILKRASQLDNKDLKAAKKKRGIWKTPGSNEGRKKK